MARTKRIRQNVWEISGWWSLPVLIFASAITVFSEPEAGINYESLRLIISAFIIFVILNYTGTFVVWLATRSRKPREKARVTARPIMLLVLAATVLFARFTEIDPAILIGTVLGVDYGSRLTQTRGAIAVLIRFVWTLAVGVSALIAYTLLASISIIQEVPEGVEAGPNGMAYLVLLLGEFCAMLAIAALASAPVSMLPLAFLDGSVVWNWNKWVWAASYVVALTVFSLVLAPMKFSWDEPSGTVIAWISVFVAYALIAVVMWLVFFLLQRERVKSDAQVAPSDAADFPHAVEEVDSSPTS